MQIKDIMTREIVLLHPDDRLRDASERMIATGLDPLPVWDGCKVVGMLTRAGTQAHAAEAGLAAGTDLVRSAMSEEVAYCSEDDEVRDVAQALTARDPSGALPGLIVLDAAQHVAGVVLREDVLTGVRSERAIEMSAQAASQPKVSYTDDPVDHDSESSFPASDPPSPPAPAG